MATAVKSQIVPIPGCSQNKPPVPPKPLPGEEKKPVKKKSDLNTSSESPLPVGENGCLNQAIVLVQQLRLKNSNAVSSTTSDKGPQVTPSSSQTSNKPEPGVKRSQSTDAKPKTKYVLKPLRQHHSFQEAKAKKQSVKRTSGDGDKSSKIRDWFCLPLASFVVKTKDGSTSLIEKGKGRLFGKGPQPPKKLKRPAPHPPQLPVLSSRPKVPPRPVLQRILADIDNGKGAGKWHKLENVKYIDEEITTEDSTDYSDVDWSQAIYSAPGEESIIYYTYIDEGPDERVIFYRSVGRDEVLSSSEDEEEEIETSHVAEMEDMEIGVCQPQMESKKSEVEIEISEINGFVAEQISSELEKPTSYTPIEVEVEVICLPESQSPDIKSHSPETTSELPEVRSESPETRSQLSEMHKNLSIIVEEEEALKSPPPRPPSPKCPIPPKSSSPIFPFISRTPSPIQKMFSRTPSPRPASPIEDLPKSESPVIIYEKIETKVKVCEKNIPVVDNQLPFIEREIPAATMHLPPDEKIEPAYARVQKYASPQPVEITEQPIEPKITEEHLIQSEPYYDLDVAVPAKSKPQRPPRPVLPPPPPKIVPPPPPKLAPPPPPKLAPPPVPPKTYMKIKFPPEKNDEVNDLNTTEEQPVDEIMEIESKEETGLDRNGDLMKETVEMEENLDFQIRPEDDLATTEVTEEVKEELMPEPKSKVENGEFLKSHLSLGDGSEISEEKLQSFLMLNETSESGFMSSPTPPPRNRRKRFRSMEGPARASMEDVGIPIPLRRTKSVSESEKRSSWTNSEASATPSSASKEKLSTIKPARLKQKPARPPKPKIMTLKQLSSEPDLTANGTESPPLVRITGRPLPPPPTPPRHRYPLKSAEKESTASKTPEPLPKPLASNFPYEFLARLSEIEAGKLNLNEINVKRINVQEIEADVIRCGSLQVGVMTPLVCVGKGKSDDGGDDKMEDKGSGKNTEDENKSSHWWDKGGKNGGNENGNLNNKKDEVKNEEIIADEMVFEEVKISNQNSPEDIVLEELAKDLRVSSGGDTEVKDEQVSDQLITLPVSAPTEVGSSTFYLAEDQSSKSRSPTPSSVISGKTGKKTRERTTSWYDEGVVPGQSGDVDTSDGRAEGSIDSPTLIKTTENQNIDSDIEALKLATSLSSLGNRKKSGKVGRGSLQLYPREESPSSSSTTDAEHEDPKSRHHRGTRSRSLSSATEPRVFQLDPNANYCVEEMPAVTNKQCHGNGHCDSPPQIRRDLGPTMMEDTEASPKLDRFSSVHDPTKRLSLLSIPTSEDSWYNCTSGDDSESESSFSTAASCQDNSSSACVTDVRRTKKYFIARELMSSERVFVDVLKLLNEDFRNAVVKANAKSDQKVIPQPVLDQILKYLPQLHNLNQDLLKDLQERIKNWEQMDQIADVITKKGPFLKLYTSYIKDFEQITSLLDDACKKYPLFAQVVKEFEISERCNKLAIKHFMLKPVQRIPQYKLILQEYLKQLNPDSPEYEETVVALNIVADVANHANQAMKQGDNFAKLLHIQNNIAGGGYEVIRPGRLFLKEGELSKLSRKVMQPRWFILFNDSLLHTDVTQGSLRLHHELPLSGMRVVVPTNEEHLNEFSVISSTRSFTLSANSLQERDEWVSVLNNAIKANAQRRGTFALAVDKAISPQDEPYSSLGKHAPVWIPDSRVTMCQSCITPFTVTFRRHHCRACGKVVCAICSANRAPLQYLKFQSARVCDECFFRLAEAFDNTATESDCSTERASQSESGENSDIHRANLKAQFKRYATSGGGKKVERRLPKVLKEVGANYQGAAISGYLNKKTKKGWRRYWFVINDKVLYTYKASEDVAALESIPLLGFKLESNSEVFEGGDSNLGFHLIHPNHHSLVFCGENEESTEKWKKEMHLATLLE